MFAAASPAHKLIGGGAGCVIEWDKTHRIFADAVTDAAHNEYLHYLLTNGLLGLGAYALFLGLTARSAVKSAAGRCLLTGCAAYAVQAAVNIAQPVSTPLFFIMLFLCGGDELGAELRDSMERELEYARGAVRIAYERQIVQTEPDRTHRVHTVFINTLPLAREYRILISVALASRQRLGR